MLPYFLSGDEHHLRTRDRGVVYAVYDLSHEKEMVAWNAQRRLWPQLAIALLVTLALAWLLRYRVTQPLMRLEAASLQMALTGDLPHPVDPGRAEELFGWHARMPFEEGLRNTIDWYLENRAEAERDPF